MIATPQNTLLYRQRTCAYILDVLLKLSYARLNNNELYYVLSKFLDDDSSRGKIYFNLVKELEILFGVNDDLVSNDLVSNYVQAGITESIITKCPFCNGTGVLLFKNSVENCPHCNEGNFIYTDLIRSSFVGVKEKDFNKEKYKIIMEKLIDIEISALDKLGDVWKKITQLVSDSRHSIIIIDRGFRN